MGLVEHETTYEGISSKASLSDVLVKLFDISNRTVLYGTTVTVDNKTKNI